ncbi:MAG: type I restriction-modification system subunit M [Bacteroidales bacterium]|nr:type I restriction-modification system subunit M [Bacteroidales bacterium]
MNKQQLANRIWASANKMRTKIEANEYKDYILGLIFYKFICDNEVNYLKNNNKWTDEDISTLKNYDPDHPENFTDEDQEIMEDLQRSIGYYICYEHLFSTWTKPDSGFSVSTLSEALKKFNRLLHKRFLHIYKNIFDSLETGLKKLGADPPSQTRVVKELIKLIKDIPTDGSQGYDVLGFVYEYLISNFAASAGKKAGEFYTPHEVAILMSEIVAEHHKNKDTLEIYDPTSGSGSLLITIGKSLSRHMADTNRIKYYAQELIESTYNLTRMNLVMRNILPSNIVTRNADSLSEDWPINSDGTVNETLYVDAVVSNPPYSAHWDATDRQDDPRFKRYGVAPKTKADYAFLLHELHHLKPDGILTIVLPHGVLFRGSENDGSEGQIRKQLIEVNNIDTIIGLPAGIFFGTGIPTIIMVLKQHRMNDDVLIIDASKGFVKDGKQNKLRPCDIRKIADTVRTRATMAGFSRAVSRDEIRQNGYNLNIPRYVDSAEQAEKHDIYATIFGGIPNSEIDDLQKYWDAFPNLRSEIFAEETEGPYSRIRTESVKDAIRANADVRAWEALFAQKFDGFAELLHERLIGNVKEVNEMRELDTISTDIFGRLADVPLVDRYAAYQAVADSWAGIVADIETIQAEGLEACRMVDDNYKLVKKNDEEIEVADGRKGRVIPFDIIRVACFQKEVDNIATLQRRIEETASELDTIREEFTEDEQQEYLTDDETPKYDKKAITAAAKNKGGDVEPDTLDKLKRIVGLWNDNTRLSKELKNAETELDKATEAKIGSLSDAEIEAFLHVKWIDPIVARVRQACADVLTDLEKAVENLSRKYSDNLSAIDNEILNSEKELESLIADLTGDEFAIRGLRELIK